MGFKNAKQTVFQCCTCDETGDEAIYINGTIRHIAETIYMRELVRVLVDYIEGELIIEHHVVQGAESEWPDHFESLTSKARLTTKQN